MRRSLSGLGVISRDVVYLNVAKNESYNRVCGWRLTCNPCHTWFYDAEFPTRARDDEAVLKMIAHWFRWFTLVGALALAGCTSLPAPVVHELAPLKEGESDAYAVSPTSMSPLQSNWEVAAEHRSHAPREYELVSGRVLVWANREAVGLFVGLFAEKFLPWTHIGIISVEPDGVWVYDTNAIRISLRGESLSDAEAGGTRRIRYQDYVLSDRVYGLYDPPKDVNVELMLDFVRMHFKRATRFDAHFNSADKTELYCSELVALAFEAGGGAKVMTEPVRVNRTFDLVRSWMNIPSYGFYLPGHLVAAERQVALWSRVFSPAQILAFFEAQSELARRLGYETRLGQLMGWNTSASSMVDALTLRSAPQRFLDASLLAVATDTQRAPDPIAVQREVLRVAEKHFAVASPH